MHQQNQSVVDLLANASLSKHLACFAIAFDELRKPVDRRLIDCCARLFIVGSKQFITAAWQTLLQLVSRTPANTDIPAPWDDPLM